MKTVLSVAVILAAVVAVGAGVEITNDEFNKLANRVSALEVAVAQTASADQVKGIDDRLGTAEADLQKRVLKDDFDKVEQRVTFLENELSEVEKATFGFSRVPTKNEPAPAKK